MAQTIRSAAGFPLPPHRVKWDIETILLGMLGLSMIYTRGMSHSFSVIQETIVLVLFLTALMGLTRIPFPRSLGGRAIPIWAYPLLAGTLSMIMDSFLVLILVGTALMEGPVKDQFKFRAYNTMAALIGGLGLYFGEVYMLPLALMYDMNKWWSMLPILPPVYVFLAILGVMTRNLSIEIKGTKSAAAEGKKATADPFDYFEFAVFIVLLLVVHNAWLCFGLILAYAAITGQGEDLIEIFKSEMEVAVMLLLVFAAVIAPHAEPIMAHFEGWKAFFPSVVNAVLVGAIYPARGDVWAEVHVISSAVLITPISSLVGVMLFRTWDEWKGYIRLAVPMAILWSVICGAWIYGPWKMGLEDKFYSIEMFERPALVVRGSPASHSEAEAGDHDLNNESAR